MKTSELVTIAALILGPIAAVATQLFFQWRHEKRQQKFWVFSTLMSMRSASFTFAPEFVRALNYIDRCFL